MLNQNASSGKIAFGYAQWAQEAARAASKTIEFGNWWRLDVTYWRVSWIEDTGELYAVERKPSDRYVVLACLDKKQVTEFMKKWFDGDNLRALFGRFNLDPNAKPQ
jgi:hypothetical protein